MKLQACGHGRRIDRTARARFGGQGHDRMRGEFGEFNPWQVPMGSITEDVLKLCGFLTYRIETPHDVDEVVGAGCDMAFDGNLSIAMLLSQRLIGRKQWVR